MKSTTNTISFLKENLRNQRWIMLIMSLITFILYPVWLIMTLTQYEGNNYALTDIIGNLENYFILNLDTVQTLSSFGSEVLLASLLLGSVSGIIAFSYLHNKRQVALYHSIPIKRKELLLIKYIVSIVNYILPLFIANVLFVIILATRGYLTSGMIIQLVFMFYYHFIMFNLGYFLAAIAMLLTGKIFIGTLGTLVFLGYAPMLAITLQAYVSTFYYHYYMESYSYWGEFAWLAQLSPLVLITRLEAYDFLPMVIMLVVTTILIALHFFLMEIRPSEVAGQSMAYRNVGKVIQGALLFLSVLGMAIFAYEAFYRSIAYLYLGGIFTGVVSYILLQLLYGVEFKKLFQQKYMFIVVTCISMLLVLSFQQDLFGYNSWMPNYNKVVDINIEFTEAGQYSTSYVEEGLYDAHMGIDKETYALVEEIITSSNNTYLNNYDTSVSPIYVEYKMENGNVIKRCYYPSTEEVSESLKYLWTNEEFLNIMYPIRTQDPSLVTYINYEVMRDGMYEYIDLFENDQEMMVAFIEAYQKDVLEINQSTIEEAPIGAFYYRLQGPVFSDVYRVFIYPSYENTIAFLEEHDMSLYYDLDVEDISYIRIYETQEGLYEEEVAYSVEDTPIYKDTHSIEVLLDELIYVELVTMFTEVDESKYAEVNLTDGSYLNYYFIK